MDLNNLLIDTLSGHGPVYPDFYEGNEEKYLTFNYPDEVGALYGDNLPQRRIVYVQVHLYLSDTEEYQEEKATICRELKATGVKSPEVTIQWEEDTRKRHIIFETRIQDRIEEE